MTRSGPLVFGAIILALMAAGLLVWTNFLDLSEKSLANFSPFSSPAQTLETRLVTPMKDAAAAGGFGATFSGREAQAWELTSGHRVERFTISGSETVFVRLASAHALDRGQVMDGLYVELPIDFAGISAGKRVEVGIVARAAQANPSNEFAMLYATRQAGNSGWHAFQLTPNFELHAFAYDVPPVAEGYNAKPVIVVRGDSNGRSLGVEVIGVYAKVLAPGALAKGVGLQFRVDFSKGSTAGWMVPEGHSLSVVRDPQNSMPLGHLTSSTPLGTPEATLGSQGAGILVPLDVVRQLNGKKIEITIRARAANPNSKVWLLLSTQQAGHTGWLSAPLTAGLESRSFRYAVPKTPNGYANPFLLMVRADDGGDSSVDIESIEIVSGNVED